MRGRNGIPRVVGMAMKVIASDGAWTSHRGREEARVRGEEEG